MEDLYGLQGHELVFAPFISEGRIEKNTYEIKGTAETDRVKKYDVLCWIAWDDFSASVKKSYLLLLCAYLFAV